MPEAVKDLLAGVASIFDFRDTANDDMDVRRSARDDYNAMRQDWADVGGDFRKALTDHDAQQSKVRD